MKVSICISSTWIKTNTNQLVQLQHIRGSCGKLAVFLSVWWKKKDTVVYVFQRVSSLRPEKKKFQSSVWRKKKDTVIYVFQRFSSLRPEKKSSSRLSGEKEKIQSSVWWVRGSGGKKKDTVVCSICISSTWIKTNTNPLVQLQHIRYI